jgi:hypothetical protein
MTGSLYFAAGAIAMLIGVGAMVMWLGDPPEQTTRHSEKRR